MTEKRDSDRGDTGGGRGDGEAGFPPRREPDGGLDPRTTGPRPELTKMLRARGDGQGAEVAFEEKPRLGALLFFLFKSAPCPR